jgi:hypothetical protein
MEFEDNSRKLVAVRFVLGAPSLALIIYATTIWSVYALPGSIQWIVAYSITLFLCILLIIFISRASLPQSFKDEKSVEYYIEELLYQEKVYVIPTICEHCKTPIELNKVRWKDEYTPHCQECQAEIKLRIIDKSDY